MKLLCPLALAQGVTEPLVDEHDKLVSSFATYPKIDGVPDLRLPNQQSGTSYDAILPEWASSRDFKSIGAGTIEPMELTEEDIAGKDVLVAGVGNGTELSAVLSLRPNSAAAVDFSSHMAALQNKVFGAQFYIGDICNLPFPDETFDYVVNAGVMQATRSPELAFRNCWRVCKPGGVLNFGHIYGPNPHNFKVTICREKYRFHEMPEATAKRHMKLQAAIYTFLSWTGLWRLHRRWRFPGVVEMGARRITDWHRNYDQALDYYLCRYRHVIGADEVADWFAQVGMEMRQTSKGYIGRK